MIQEWLVLLNAFSLPAATSDLLFFPLCKSSFAHCKTKSLLRYREEGLVPETGFEPARRFQRHHLKVVRLPISPPGQSEGCKSILFYQNNSKSCSFSWFRIFYSQASFMILFHNS